MKHVIYATVTLDATYCLIKTSIYWQDSKCLHNQLDSVSEWEEKV